MSAISHSLTASRFGPEKKEERATLSLFEALEGPTLQPIETLEDPASKPHIPLQTSFLDEASRLGKVDHLSVQMALLCEPLGQGGPRALLQCRCMYVYVCVHRFQYVYRYTYIHTHRKTYVYLCVYIHYTYIIYMHMMHNVCI